MPMNLKVLIAATGFAALASSPVLAASHARHHHAAPAGAVSNAIVAPTGQRLGTDPDPSIRFELRRDWSTGVGANSGD
jgi:hypothetical protein